MPFSESVKQEVRRRSHFRCCLCHSLGVEVHHLEPQADSGSDESENAAALCPSCHETYGANPTKRRFLREARDLWYELCEKRYASDGAKIDAIHSLMSTAATKQDLAAAVLSLTAAVRTDVAPRRADASEEPEIPDGLLAHTINSLSLKRYLRIMYPTVRHCGSDAIDKLVRDVIQVRYTDIRSIHSMMRNTSGAFADVAREKRDSGEEMDKWTDSFPIRLFLPVFDEHYCRLHFPKLFAERETKAWMRPESPRPAV